MYILYGTKYTKKDLGKLWVTPRSSCNVVGWQHLKKLTKWFSLFFIPIIPYKTELFTCCQACDACFEIKKGYENKLRHVNKKAQQW